jgi:TonB family protein
VLDQAAANAAMKWQFKLRVVDGKPVRTWAKIPVTFRLSNPAAASSSAHVVPGSKTSRPPIYPVDAIKHREQGTVVLKILVGIDGKPETVQVDQSSGSASLDQAAVKAAKQWQFQPGMKDGKPYSGWTRVPVSFHLRRVDVSATSASAAPAPPPPAPAAPPAPPAPPASPPPAPPAAPATPSAPPPPPPERIILLQTPPAGTSSTH